MTGPQNIILPIEVYQLVILCPLASLLAISPDQPTQCRQSMLNAARRGPSSVARSLSSLSKCTRCGRPDNTRNIQRCLPQFIYPTIQRPFGSSSQWRIAAAAKAVAEDEDIEEDTEPGGYSQKQPSGAHSKPAEQHGPVTRFEDLAKRGMVCQTVVDTITKKMGLETMTQVQSLTISESLKGQDM